MNKFSKGLVICLRVCGVYTKAQTLAPIILQVNIEPTADNPGAVKLIWEDNNVFDVDSFSVFKLNYDENHPGYQSIATVGTMSYWDTTARANIQSESYKVISESYGDTVTQSPISDPHNTIYLQPIIYDTCNMINTLSWNSYKGWQGGVYYNIIDGNENIIRSGYTDTIFAHNVQPGKDYAYYIRAIQKDNPSFKSVSNKAFITTSQLKVPESSLFYINTINYNGSSVDFSVNIDNSADLLGHSLMYSSSQNSGYSEVDFKELDYNTIDFNHSTEEDQPLFYKVNAIGVCSDTVAQTQVVKPIVLVAKSTETDVALNWNSSYIESTENYTINISVDGTTFPSENTDANTANFNFEDIDPQNTAEVFCFTIQATETNSNTSSSNTVCVSRIPKIEAPTAFSPNGDGTNDNFGPFWENGNENSYIKNAIVEEFKLIIYDKYGGTVFSTDNSSDKWNGTANGGSPVTEGGYIYYLWFKTTQGKSYEKSGTINVVYP